MVETLPAALACPDCAALRDADDNFCRRCGLSLAAGRLPVARRTVAVAFPRPSLPAPVKRAAVIAATGAALRIGAGIAGRLLARRAAPSAAKAPARRPRSGPGRATVVSEALFVRRIWFERD